MAFSTSGMQSIGAAKRRAEDTPTTEKVVVMVKGEDALEDIDTSCGYVCCKSEGCQSCCNTPKGLGAAISIYTLEYGIIILGVLNIIIVPLQRRYQFTATQAAWIPASQDVFGAIFSIIFGYVGTFVHKGKLLTLSALSQSVGSFIFVLVHILTPKYELGVAESALCDPETELNCDFETGQYDMFFVMFIVAQMFHGLAGGILWCVAVPYMDENVKLKNTPVYIGVMYAFAAIGSMIGYIVGGGLLLVFVDIGRVDPDDVTITPLDPRWVGAWWIPYASASVLGLFCAFYLSTYPKQIPAAIRYRAERKTQAYAGVSDTTGTVGDSALKKMWRSTVILFKNPTYVLLTLAGIFESGLMVGFIVFLPMILVFQFQQTPASAAIYGGAVVVPAAIGGQILGGLIPKWLNLKVRGLILQTGLMALFVFALTPASVIRCELQPIAGVNRAIENTSIVIPDPQMTAVCNEPCGCDTRSYNPVCGTNDIEYFSPCHAACIDQSWDFDNSQMLYHECACIPAGEEEHDGTSGICETDCTLFANFLAIFFFLTLATFIGVTSGISAAVRCVPETERSHAIGLQSTIVRLFGNVPFPILIGAMFDSHCDVWQYTCEERGACWIYDGEAISIALAVIAMSAKGIAVVCHSLALFFYKAPPEEVEEGEVGQTKMDGSGKENHAYEPHESKGFRASYVAHKTDNSNTATTYEVLEIAPPAEILEASTKL